VEHNGKGGEKNNMNHSFARAIAFSLILTAPLAQAAQPADEITHTVRAEMDKQHIQISRYVDDRLTVVVLTNQGNCDPHVIADEVAAVYFGKRSRSK
jgi:hypothetical protein